MDDFKNSKPISYEYVLSSHLLTFSLSSLIQIGTKYEVRLCLSCVQNIKKYVCRGWPKIIWTDQKSHY